MDHRDTGFWAKTMEVIYLTPTGRGPKNFKSLSLKRFADSHTGSSDPYTKLLADILEEMYGGDSYA